MADSIPTLFHMDDYSECIKNKDNIFCNVQAKLEFVTNNKLFEIIKNVSADKKSYDRSLIHRGLCVPKVESQNFTNYKEELFKEPFIGINTNLTDLEVISCTKNVIPVTILDKILLTSLTIYISLIIFTNIYDFNRSKAQGKISERLYNFLQIFSIPKYWKQKWSLSKNEDFRKLQSMQSIRFLLMALIVFLHVLIVNNLSFNYRPLQFEKDMHYLYNPLLMFIVLPFFMFSSWLLLLQIQNIENKGGELSFNNVIIIIINRYWRLGFCLAIAILIQLSTILQRLGGPLTFSLIDLNDKACRNNWLKSMTFFGNFDTALNNCYLVSWYLSADFQIYVINLFVLYIKSKLKIKNSLFFVYVLLFACGLHGLYLFSSGDDVIYTINIRHFEEYGLRTSHLWVVHYTSTYSVWGCSIIGLILGEIYIKMKTVDIKKSKILTILWGALFAGCPLLVLTICNRKSTVLEAAVLRAIVKPLFNFGIGIGILGMSQNIGGFVKRIFEFKYFALMGNFTYATYLVHMLPILVWQSTYNWPWHPTAFQMIKDFIIVSLITWPLGILLTLIIEEPGLAIQKQILPQVIYKKATKEIHEEKKDN